MADNLASFKVFCQGGLNTSRDVLSQGETQPGTAISLINYEPAVTGGYRKINGFANNYGTVTGTGSVLVVCVADGTVYTSESEVPMLFTVLSLNVFAISYPIIFYLY